MNAILLEILAIIIPIIIPIKYTATIISPEIFGKKAFARKPYIGSLAEQLINGVSIIVILRSRSDDNVLLDITAGTVQPKPINIGTILFPESPILLSSLSITNAILAIYPESSRSDRKKNSTTIIGTKLTTEPTPTKIPSVIRACNDSLTFIDVNRLSTTSVR